MKIVCERGGQSLTFAYSFPCWLESVEGLEDSVQSVTTRKPTGADGVQYTGSTANMRNIVITAICHGSPEEHQKLRERFFSFFQPRSSGTLYLHGSGEAKKIAYYPESCVFEPSGRYRQVTVSLICPDPIFLAASDETVSMAEITGLIEWTLELTGDFEAGIRSGALMATIVNPSNVARGLTIRFEAAGEVLNPGMIEVTRQEKFRILATMHAGDTLTVTTGEGDKRVRMSSGDSVTNINHKWEFGGTWLKAEQGTNVFRFTAEEGAGALSVYITSTPAFWGA